MCILRTVIDCIYDIIELICGLGEFFNKLWNNAGKIMQTNNDGIKELQVCQCKFIPKGD